MMLVRFVGSGDAFGSGGRFQTCIQVQDDAMTLLVDCGATSLVALKSRGLDPAEIDAVVVSHLHGDHFGGIPLLILDGQFARRTRPLTIAGPVGVEGRVTAAMEVLFPGSSTVTRRFTTSFVEIPGDLVPVVIGAASVRAAEVVHACGAPPLALRVELGGSTLAYSGDTEWTDALLEVCRGADLFVCEAYTYDKKVRFHLDYATLRAQLPRLQARKIMVTHMSTDMLDRLSQVDLPAACDGMTLRMQDHATAVC